MTKAPTYKSSGLARWHRLDYFEREECIATVLRRTCWRCGTVLRVPAALCGFCKIERKEDEL